MFIELTKYDDFLNKHRCRLFVLFMGFFSLLLALILHFQTVIPLILSEGTEIRVAHVGNSIQFFNDIPRFLQHMLGTKYDFPYQDSCFHGGQNLESLWVEGNGMHHKFNTTKALLPDGSYDVGRHSVRDLLHSHRFDFIIMNDFTQYPARENTTQVTLEALSKHYIPLFLKSKVTPVLLQTWAYRKPEKGSEDLGTIPQFTHKLRHGYETYLELMHKEGLESAVIAPVGNIYLHLYEHDNSTWNQLFYVDNFHPSPHGTWLEACTLFGTITGAAPPRYNASWWNTSRVMMPLGEIQLRLPTDDEAEHIRKTVIRYMKLNETDV